MKILITGGSGFIGSHIAQRLLDDKHEVVILDNLSSGQERHPLEAKLIKDTVLGWELDLLFQQENFELVIHAASLGHARSSYQYSLPTFELNLMSGAALINSCIQHKVSGFIYLSDLSVYGGEYPIINPTESYSIAKRSVELLLQSYGAYLPYVIVRLPSVIGPGMNLADGNSHPVSVYINQVLRGEPIKIKGPDSRLDTYRWVEDVVNVVKDAVDVKDELPNEEIDLGGNVHSQIEVATLIRGIFGGSEIIQEHNHWGMDTVLQDASAHTSLKEELSLLVPWAQIAGAKDWLKD